ncbi:hypothetical protein P43SY_008147 [Pythium insidiosum]|uniref:Barwin domain-containing protein n=1 Tax=Pythium insidiosum TaxID=114742 RepID=A0AAD5LFK2_PYTIN|nr:hypothetical protein P43SY_008147 [Pythium insidiosum]
MSIAKMSLAVLAAVAACGSLLSSVSAAPATASYHIYDGVRPEQTSCNIPFSDISRISAYANLGGDLKCGDCVRITNTATKASVVVQIVDRGGAIFDMSKQAFDSIDTDKQGYARGRLDIDYVKVACGGGGGGGSAPAPQPKPQPQPTPRPRPVPTRRQPALRSSGAQLEEPVSGV